MNDSRNNDLKEIIFLSIAILCELKEAIVLVVASGLVLFAVITAANHSKNNVPVHSSLVNEIHDIVATDPKYYAALVKELLSDDVLSINDYWKIKKRQETKQILEMVEMTKPENQFIEIE